MPFVRKRVRRNSLKNSAIGIGIALFLLMVVYLFADQLWPFVTAFGQFSWRVARHVHSMVVSHPKPVAPAVTFASPGGGNPNPAPRPTDPALPLMREAFDLMEQKKPDLALEKVNAALKLSSQNPKAYELRGDIYSEKKLWDPAVADYRSVLQLDVTNIQVKFNLAEIKFMQKKYDEARPGFVDLKDNSILSDLAAYKIFLCDLWGGHQDLAAKELDAFNQVGLNPSYYFANVAWSLYHHQTEEARGWLRSAAGIYSPNKYKLYSTSLIDLGYLPLPPPPKT